MSRKRKTDRDSDHVYGQKYPRSELQSIYPYAIECGMEKVTTTDTILHCHEVYGEKFYNFALSETTLRVGNLNWLFRINDETDHTYTLQLSLDEVTTATNWSLTFNVSLVFRNMQDKNRRIEKHWRGNTFKPNDDTLDLQLEKKELADVFRVDDWNVGDSEKTEKMTIELHIIMVSSLGFRTRSRVSYDFSKRTDSSDILLILPFKQELYASLGFLAHHSGYFAALQRRLSNLPIDEASGLPFETINDVEYHEFANLLLLVYPSRKKVNDDSVPYLLRLADRFLFEGVLADLEHYLMRPKSRSIDVFEKLQWSFTYDMSDLQHKLLKDSLNSRETISRVKNSPTYPNLSPEVKNCLFERLISDEIKEKSSDSSRYDSFDE